MERRQALTLRSLGAALLLRRVTTAGRRPAVDGGRRVRVSGHRGARADLLQPAGRARAALRRLPAGVRTPHHLSLWL